MNGALRAFIQQKRREGWRFSEPVVDGSGHLRFIVTANGRTVVWVAPATPGRYNRSIENSKAEVKRLIRGRHYGRREA